MPEPLGLIGFNGSDEKLNLANRSIGTTKLLAFSEAVRTMENKTI